MKLPFMVNNKVKKVRLSKSEVVKTAKVISYKMIMKRLKTIEEKIDVLLEQNKVKW